MTNWTPLLKVAVKFRGIEITHDPEKFTQSTMKGYEGRKLFGKPILEILGKEDTEKRVRALSRHRGIAGVAARHSKAVLVKKKPIPKKTFSPKKSKEFKDLVRLRQRITISHEMFHAKAPVLGRSEIATRAYSGFKGPKGVSLGRRLLSGAREALATPVLEGVGFKPILSKGTLRFILGRGHF